ncbi:MAG: hypothetical protein WCE45_01180 [Sedimentisphaerales bacterium]
MPVIVITHQTRQDKIAAAIKDLGKLDVVKDNPVCIRIVDIPEDNVE